MKPIAFIGGVHGVGKSTLSIAVAKTLQLSYASAGKLIAGAKSHSAASGKRVDDVDDNQNVLASAIEALPGSAPIILDGHFTVLDHLGEPSKIPEAIYSLLAPKCVVILTEDPKQIFERLFARDGKGIPVDTLEAMQRLEIGYGKQICARHSIPLQVGSPDEVDSATAFIRLHLGLAR